MIAPQLSLNHSSLTIGAIENCDITVRVSKTYEVVDVGVDLFGLDIIIVINKKFWKMPIIGIRICFQNFTVARGVFSDDFIGDPDNRWR